MKDDAFCLRINVRVPHIVEVNFIVKRNCVASRLKTITINSQSANISTCRVLYCIEIVSRQ